MTEFTPDKWVIIRLYNKKLSYKVFSGWYPDYQESGRWRLSSDITRHDFDGDFWWFFENSGDAYRCYLDGYGLTYETANLLEKWGEDATMLRDQEWNRKGWVW